MIQIALIILFFCALGIIGLNQFNIHPGYLWFLAIGGCFISFMLVLLSYPKEPFILTLITWGKSGLFTTYPQLRFDSVSWSFGAAIAAITVSVVLTDVSRAQEVEPGYWAAGLALAGFGLLAVMANNLVTLLMTWVAIDVLELWIKYHYFPNEFDLQGKSFYALLVRAIGLMLASAAIIKSNYLGVPLTFTSIPIDVTGILVLVAFLRLGVFPIQSSSFHEKTIRRGLGTLIRIIIVAPSLLLLTRIAPVGITPGWNVSLMILAAIAILFGGYNWAISRHELEGRQFWILGMSAFCIIAAAINESFTSQVWGLSLLFSGSILFLFSVRNREISWIAYLGLVGFIPLPFTPVGKGLSIFTGMNLVLMIIIIIGLASLLFGYYKQITRETPQEGEIDRLDKIAYPSGMGLLVLAYFGIVLKIKGLPPASGWSLSENWWVGIIICGFAGILVFINKKSLFQPAYQVNKIVKSVVSFKWMDRYIYVIYQFFGTILSYIARILEGRGGVLWVVIVTLFLISIIQQNLGGG
jgi:hypothetical protein